jgi:hypothetical protein
MKNNSADPQRTAMQSSAEPAWNTSAGPPRRHCPLPCPSAFITLATGALPRQMPAALSTEL